VIALCAAAWLGGCGGDAVEALEDDTAENLMDGSRAAMATCPNGGNVQPVVPSFGAEIDDYAKYDGQKTCESSEKPGVKAFRDLILATYPCTSSSGISRECSSGGTSEHKEGRAWDWGLDYPHPAATALLAWLTATDARGNSHAMARRFGIMYMIWNRQIWKAYQAEKGWQHYTGSNDHADHVHFSFSWNGALKKTSYWTGGGTVLPPDAGVRPDTKIPQVPDKGVLRPDTGALVPDSGTTPTGGDPVGALESLGCDLVSGWAQDLAAKTSPVPVEICFDVPADTVGSKAHPVTANQYRDDLCANLGSCGHGFLLAVPKELVDGESHQVFAYAVTPSGTRRPLQGSPRTLTCAAVGVTTSPSPSPEPEPEPGAGGSTASGGRVVAGCSAAPAGASPSTASLLLLLLGLLACARRATAGRTAGCSWPAARKRSE
jgi:hypothetical protein